MVSGWSCIHGGRNRSPRAQKEGADCSPDDYLPEDDSWPFGDPFRWEGGGQGRSDCHPGGGGTAPGNQSILFYACPGRLFCWIAPDRHKGTIGGNICLNTRCYFYNRSPFWRTEYPECRKASGGLRCYVLRQSRKGCVALQSGDTVGPLVALGAKVRLLSERGDRVLAVEDLFLGDGIDYLALEPGEILTEILLPPSSRDGIFIKFRPQNNLDFATFTLSVLPPGDGMGSRIVAGSVASRPLRAKEAEGMLDRGNGDMATIARMASEELKLISFVRGAVPFKRMAIQARLTEILAKDLKFPNQFPPPSMGEGAGGGGQN